MTGYRWPDVLLKCMTRNFGRLVNAFKQWVTI